MNQRSFWTYSLISLICSSLLLLITGLIFSGGETTEQQEYAALLEKRSQLEQEQRNWFQQNAVELEYRHFEEALAGIRPVHALHKQYQRPAENLIQLLNGADAETIRIVQGIVGVSDASIIQKREQLDVLRSYSDKIRLPNDQMSKKVIEVVLGDPERAAKIFSGDVNAIPDWLPKRIPEQFNALNEPLPPEPRNTNTALFSTLPSGYWLLKWAAISSAFAFLFTLAGLTIRGHAMRDLRYESNQNREKRLREARRRWSHPLQTLPVSITGWLVFLTVIPGFVVLHIIRLMNLNLIDGWKTWRRRRRLRGEGFDKEYSDVLSQLQDLRAEAADTGSEKDLHKIDEAMEAVRATRNAEHMLRISNAVKGVKEGLADREAAMHELDEFLEPGSASTASAAQ